MVDSTPTRQGPPSSMKSIRSPSESRTCCAVVGLMRPKALALGADAVAVSNAAIQAIGCLGMRACETNNCPVGIATQQSHLRQRLAIDKSAEKLNSFFRAATELMQVMARACGHNHLDQFTIDDLTTWKREMAHLTGIAYGGVSLR